MSNLNEKSTAFRKIFTFTFAEYLGKYLAWAIAVILIAIFWKVLGLSISIPSP